MSLETTTMHGIPQVLRKWAAANGHGDGRRWHSVLNAKREEGSDFWVSAGASKGVKLTFACTEQVTNPTTGQVVKEYQYYVGEGPVNPATPYSQHIHYWFAFVNTGLLCSSKMG